MGYPGLALGYLGWLLGGCAAYTESVGVRWDRFTPVRSDRQLVYASCPWAVDGWGMVLVSPVILWCRWCGLSAVGLGVLELTWNASNVVVSGLVLMLDCPWYIF